MLKELVTGFHHDDSTMIIGSAKGGVTLPNKNNSSVVFGGAAVSATWQEQNEGTASTYIWSQKNGENWQYGVQNDTGSTQTLVTYSLNLKKVGAPDVILQAVVWESNKSTVKALSTNTITGSDLTTSFVMTDFTFDSVEVESDEYFGFRANNEGTDIFNQYIAAERDASQISTQLYNDWADTTLAGNYYSLTWQAKA